MRRLVGWSGPSVRWAWASVPRPSSLAAACWPVLMSSAAKLVAVARVWVCPSPSTRCWMASVAHTNGSASACLPWFCKDVARLLAACRVSACSSPKTASCRSSELRNTASASLSLPWGQGCAAQVQGSHEGVRVVGAIRTPPRCKEVAVECFRRDKPARLAACTRWRECSAQTARARSRQAGLAAAPTGLPPGQAAWRPCPAACRSGTLCQPTWFPPALVLCIGDLACHVGAPAPASSRHPQPPWMGSGGPSLSKQMQHAISSLHACLCPPRFQCSTRHSPRFAAAERLLAVPALLPVLVVVYRARALLPARRARPWCAPLLSGWRHQHRCWHHQGGSGAGRGAERVVCTLTNRALATDDDLAATLLLSTSSLLQCKRSCQRPGPL